MLASDCSLDQESVLLLPRVCELLAASGSALPDDTSLEKLLDWFTQLSQAGLKKIEKWRPSSFELRFKPVNCFLNQPLLRGFERTLARWDLFALSLHFYPCLHQFTLPLKHVQWSSGTTLHESFPCLLEFISSVTDNTAADPAIIAFMIKLTGLLAATVAGFQVLQDRSTLDRVFNIKHWQELSLWEDPSVKSGWVHGLRSMLQHPRALSFFIQSELMEHLLQLQTDPSLFVASSTSQLLAHILLFFQPEPSAKDGEHHAQEVERGTHNGVSCTEYNTAVATVCAYVKEFLPRKDQKTLQHSSRLLRLVAQILSEASPPLSAQLFEAVCGSLEDVTAGPSQLTLPLMEVILAAHRLSHVGQSVIRLLSAVLDSRQPTERIQAAAAVLQKGFCDPLCTPKAVTALLLPLDIVTGQSLLCPESSAEAWAEIQEEVQNKSSFTSMMLMCVANIHHIALLPKDFLPCPPALMVSAVVSLLHMSIGVSSVSPGCVQADRYIYGNRKIQKCALEALTALSNCSENILVSDVCDKVQDVCTVLLLYLNDPDSDSIMLHKCFQGLLQWTSSSTNRSLLSVQFRRDLVQLVHKRVCDLRWEVRDSTVEFLGEQATQTSPVDLPQSPLLLEERSTVPLLREALQDQESYVRASAVSALAQTLQRGWQQGAVVAQEQADIVTKLLSILCEDTEGFSRRAVVQFFISWFCHSSSSSSTRPSLLMTSVPSVLSRGSSDLDWEVKVRTLELADLLTDSTLAGHTQPPHPYAAIAQPAFSPLNLSSEDALGKLVEMGVISVLLSGLFDCDRPVGLKACQSLIKLRETLDTSKQGSTVKCCVPSFGWGLEIRALLDSSNDSVNVHEVLRCLSLAERLDVLSQSSDHVQNSPLSLLKDILTARDVHCHPNTAEGQEVIVDCY